jgi:hypothetical protein
MVSRQLIRWAVLRFVPCGDYSGSKNLERIMFSFQNVMHPCRPQASGE